MTSDLDLQFKNLAERISQIEPTVKSLEPFFEDLSCWFKDPNDNETRQKARDNLVRNTYPVRNPSNPDYEFHRFMDLWKTGELEMALLVLKEWCCSERLKLIPQPIPMKPELKWEIFRSIHGSEFDSTIDLTTGQPVPKVWEDWTSVAPKHKPKRI